MSPPEIQYVYIPNLVGRQMLRIPIDDVEAEGQISLPTTVKSAKEPMTRESSTRESSPAPSVESVEAEE